MHSKALTVLVIDDDHDLAELIACALAREKIRPVIAVNGIAGLQHAQLLLPSLILCDARMREIDGLQVIESLRSDPATAHIPIVLMSGNDAACFDGSGADAFLQKPFQMATMLAMVERFVAKRPVAMDERQPEVLECAP